MPFHPEELRLASSLRELIHEYGTTVEDIEGRMGWETDRLTSLLEGRAEWRLGELFEVLSGLEVAPSDFFSRVDGEDLREAEASLVRCFESSKKVIDGAVARRFTLKRERLEI